MELARLIDVVAELDLVPIEINLESKEALVLGIKGNLFRLTFDMIYKIYSSYLAGNIGEEYYVQTV